MTQDNLNKIVDVIKNVLNPQKIILFGSYSRGENIKGSDFDLAVLQKNAPQLGQKAKVIKKLWDEGYNWETEPDIHIFSEKSFNERLKNNSFYIKEIMKGKTIYAV